MIEPGRIRRQVRGKRTSDPHWFAGQGRRKSRVLYRAYFSSKYRICKQSFEAEAEQELDEGLREDFLTGEDTVCSDVFVFLARSAAPDYTFCRFRRAKDSGHRGITAGTEHSGFQQVFLEQEVSSVVQGSCVTVDVVRKIYSRAT